jgi:hypothetical protein
VLLEVPFRSVRSMAAPMQLQTVEARVCYGLSRR